MRTRARVCVCGEVHAIRVVPREHLDGPRIVTDHKFEVLGQDLRVVIRGVRKGFGF